MDHLFPAQPPPPAGHQQQQPMIMNPSAFNGFVPFQSYNMNANMFQGAQTNPFLYPMSNTVGNATESQNMNPSMNQSFVQQPQFSINNNFLQQMHQHQPQNQVINITLQYGSQKDFTVVKRTNDPQMFQLFRQKACQMVERQVAVGASSNNAQRNGSGDSTSSPFFSSPSAATVSLSVDELQLFLHDYRSPNMLEPLTALSQLDNGSIVEIIRIDRRNEHPTRPHCLQVNTYMTPTFCDYCGEILVGLIKQGLQCSLCKCNFHKKCAFAPRNNCAKNELDVPQNVPSLVSNAAGSFLPSTTQDDQMSIGSGVMGQNNTPSPNLPQFLLPHTLSIHNYKTPTVCKVCDKMLLGIIKQGMRCRDCKVNVHKKCAAQLPMNCQITAENAITPSFDQMCVSDAASSNPPIADLIAMNDQSGHDFAMDAMIPLARLPGSASIRSGRQGPLCEGWMIHFLLNPCDEESTGELRRLRHYWILANGAISMFAEYNNDGWSISLSLLLLRVDGPRLRRDRQLGACTASDWVRHRFAHRHQRSDWVVPKRDLPTYCWWERYEEVWICGSFWGPRGAKRREDPKTTHKSTLLRSAPLHSVSHAGSPLASLATTQT
ncbi:phorbol esters/diacylglycerol binding domain (C1 domain) domain-containing protein [Ditylenchus destructor]|uniref:Phorbol esters/diacylglycerol binding domain (C1 domain) domain-containing protein n=1 Tax=Ditylenchus destructor TaxID=166010 RepID=A0AAD4N4Q4_9BILA|nr:phorbol esters/diacylglycerol binding domain (C1 domain) domain-containing protein [Ditylenchus destructor]